MLKEEQCCLRSYGVTTPKNQENPSTSRSGTSEPWSWPNRPGTVQQDLLRASEERVFQFPHRCQTSKLALIDAGSTKLAEAARSLIADEWSAPTISTHRLLNALLSHLQSFNNVCSFFTISISFTCYHHLVPFTRPSKVFEASLPSRRVWGREHLQDRRICGIFCVLSGFIRHFWLNLLLFQLSRNSFAGRVARRQRRH